MTFSISYDPDLTQDQVASLRRFEQDIRAFAGDGTFYWECVETNDVVSFYETGEVLLELRQVVGDTDHHVRCFIRGSEVASFTSEKLVDQLKITGKPPAS